MIKINVIKNNDAVEKISILGHAGYDIYGKDIVCASVSGIVITTVNAILRFDDKALTYDQLKDDLEITINTHSSVTDTLINNMLELLKELEKNYKKNIKINI